MELNWFKFYSCLIAYVTEFVRTNLHVDATIMKNKGQKSLSQVSPMKEKLFNGQIPGKDRQASGRTVEKEQHDCRQNLLHNLWGPLFRFWRQWQQRTAPVDAGQDAGLSIGEGGKWHWMTTGLEELFQSW